MSSESKAAAVEEELFGGSKDDEEETIAVGDEGSEDDALFDRVVCALQDILMDAEFTELQGGFCSQHCDLFEDTEENKLEYSPVFEEYVNTMEAFIEERLARVVEGFDMSWFAHQLAQREDEVTGDVSDVLMSFTDFQEFKGLMLSHQQGALELGGAQLALEPSGAPGAPLGAALGGAGLSLDVSGEAEELELESPM